jgi:predicted Zn-dependent protease with MMP-like domain
MKREHFVKVVEEVLDSIPREFRSRIRNVAVLVEDMPPNQPSSSHSGHQRRLLLGLFHGVPTARKSTFDLPTGPDHIVLYQKNIEGCICPEIRQSLRMITSFIIHDRDYFAAICSCSKTCTQLAHWGKRGGASITAQRVQSANRQSVANPG